MPENINALKIAGGKTKTKAQKREQKSRKRIGVAGKSVFTIKKIITKKASALTKKP